MSKYEEIIRKILESNFLNSTIKTTYLYNEFFISISSKENFLLFGISYKALSIKINKYKGEDTNLGKILFVLIKKYETIFISFLKIKQINLFNLGDESDFINIYDKKELNYKDIKEKLNFSFLDDYSYRRKIQDEFNFEDKSLLDIYHSDFECSKCSGPKEIFTSFQDFSDNYNVDYFGENNSKKSQYLYTNITDYESITIGGNDKINEILRDKYLLSNYDMLSVNKTCISVIMGDDIESIFKFNNIPKEKIFYTNQNTDSQYRAIVNFLKNINFKNIYEKEEIVFFGLNKNQNTYELIKILENNFGIKIGDVLLPNINKKNLEEILSYKFAVFFTGREVKAQNIFKLYPIDNFESLVPYGLSKTYELYDNILSKYNIDNYKEKLDLIFDYYKKSNSILFKKSNKYQIGFIISDFHISQFLNDNFRGTTIMSILNDMGFKLNFYIYRTKGVYKKYIDDFNAKNDLENFYNFNTIVSDKKEDLDKFIDDKNIQIYYSEINNDDRILLKNKEIFSVGDLEYGIEGFFRTFELLIKKCERVDYFNNLL